MDFHAAMETFAEAWVAANTQTVVNTEQQTSRSTPLEDPPTMLSKEQLSDHTRHMQMMRMKKSQSKQPEQSPDTLIPTTSGSGKSVPVHCIVEQTVKPADGSTSSTVHSTVDMDSYAILPGTTLFSELVRTALIKLGYSNTEAIGAKGAVQIKNWKPLTFDTVTDNPDATVDEILGELTSVATLRIRLCSTPKINALDDVKEKLLQVLLHQAQGVLITSGCPIEKTVLSLLSKGKSPSEITSEMKSAFEKWYKDQLIKLSQNHSSPPTPGPIDLSMPDPISQSTPVNYSMKSDSPSYASIMGKRMRTSFDPEHEIPRLHRWFQQTQHPTREQMLDYLKELNSLESRWGRKPLDLTNIIYWFKNARAAQRRASRTTEACPDDSVETDDIEDRLSPTPLENIPLLPNKNAVYIVKDPLYCSSKENKTPVQELNASSSRQSPDEEQKNMEVSATSQEPAQNNTCQEGGGEISQDDRGPARELTPPKRADSVNSSSGESQSSGSNERSGIAVLNGGDGMKNVNNNNNNKEMLVKKEMKTEEDSDHHNQDDDMDDNNDEDNDDEDDDNSRDYQSVSNSSTPQPAPYTLHHNIHMTPVPQHLGMHYIHPSGHHPIYSQMAEAHMLSNHHQLNHQINSPLNSSSEERKKRSRIFIDPLTEIPKLEKWFSEDTHPSSFMIEKYTDDLNRSEYRQRFPKLEPKNVQLWFKNHRAKVKRARIDGGVMSEDGSSLREDGFIHCQ